MSQAYRKFLSGLATLSLVVGGAALSATLSAPTASAAPVVVSSVDFSDGTTGAWSRSGGDASTLSFVADPDDPANKVLQVNDRAGDYVGIESPKGIFEEGVEYTFSLRLRLAAGTPATSARFIVKPGYNWVANTPVSADVWTVIKGTYVADKDSSQVYIGTSDLSDKTPYTYLVDDIKITKPGAEPKVTTVSAVDFSDGTTGAWSRSGGDANTLSFVADPDDPANKVLQVNDRAGDYVGIESPTKLFTEGVEYTFSMRLRLAAGTPATSARFIVKPGYNWVANTPVTADAWTVIKGTYVADKDSDQIYIGTSDLSPKAPYTYLVDDILITKPTDSGTGPTEPTGPTPGTVIINTDFENSTLQGWVPRQPDSTTPTVAVVDGGANSTAHAAQVSDRDSDGDGMQFNVADHPDISGATLEFEAWVRFAPGELVGEATLSARTVNGGSQAFGNLMALTGLRNDGWVKVGGQFTMPKFDSAAEIYFETKYNSMNTSTFLVDQVRVWVPEPPVVQTDLKPLKDSVDFPVGVAIDSRETANNPALLLTHHFNQITPENHMKVEAWYDGTTFRPHAEALALLDFAQANDLRLYGHVLVWHSQTPAWFFTDDSGRQLTSSDADRAFLADRLETHINNIAKAISDKYGKFGSATNPMVAWDVVNEVVSDAADPDDGLRRSNWYAVFGEDYIPLAFRLADKAFNDTYAAPGTDRPIKLFINDYNTEQTGKQERYYKLVRRLLAANVPIDGVGHQFHVSVTTPVSSLQGALDRFAGLGLQQAVTELDVTTPAPVSQADLIRQGYFYRDAFRAFRAHQAADHDLFSVTIWGLTDDRSWRSAQKPLLFDAGLQAKPAYFGAVDSTKLPPLVTAANVFGGDVPLANAAGAIEWRNLPAQQLTDTAGSFTTRWNDDHLTVLVSVASDAADAVELQYGDQTYRIGADGSSSPAVPVTVLDDGAGWRLVAHLPHTGVKAGGQGKLDVRVLHGTTVLGAWNSPGSTGTLTFLESLSTVNVAPAATVPVIDGTIDPVWADAAAVTTGRTVEGNAAGATAQVRTLWAGDTLYALYEVTDPVIDLSGSDPWVQDSVELFLDPGNAKNGGYRAEDAQLRISADNVVSFGTGDQAAQAARLTSATSRTDTGYIVELAVTLLDQGGADTFQGVDFQVNDGRNGSRYSVHTWAEPTGTGYQTTARWGVGHLVAATPVDPGPTDPVDPDPTDPVDPGPVVPQPIVNLAPPAIIGTVAVAQRVSVQPGSWSPEGVTFAYQWSLNGKAIKGATASSYKVPGSAKGKKLSVVVTASGNGATAVSVTSASVKVKAKLIVNKSKPKVTGKVKVGKVVTANPGKWSEKRVKFSYTWKLNGKKLSYGGKHLRVPSSAKGKSLTVTVKASKKGFTSASATSKAAKVAKR